MPYPHFSLDAIRALATEKTFARGTAYFHEGAVGVIDEDGDTISATVTGTHPYHVELTNCDGELDYDCTCPVGEDGDFCKHAVALALAWLENGGKEVFHDDAPKKKRASKADTLRQYLETLSESELRDTLIDAAERDPDLRDRLIFAAKGRDSRGIADLRGLINQATNIRGHVDWRDAWQYGERLTELAAVLEKRIDSGDAKLVELIEQAITQAETALEHIDDSNGDVYPGIERLRDAHLLACSRLHPDPVALADRLFRYQMEGAWDTFYTILPTYEAALGESGLARYQELVEAEYNKLPALTAKDTNKSWESRRNRLEAAMTTLAKRRGDVDAIVAIKSRDLSSPMQYLDLAQLLAEHSRFDEALTWASDGIAAFRERGRIEDLLTFCIEEHQRRGNPDDVEKLAWQRFERRPDDEAFALLLKTAKRIGRYDDVRWKALSFLDTRVTAEETSGKKPSVWTPCTRNTLVEIHLAEGNGEAMWTALKGGPTSPTLWERCAAMRGKTHPEDAVALYFKLLPSAVDEGARNARYETAFRLVQSIGKLRRQQGKTAEFGAEIARIRLEYKAKRNLIKALSVL